VKAELPALISREARDLKSARQNPESQKRGKKQPGTPGQENKQTIPLKNSSGRKTSPPRNGGPE